MKKAFYALTVLTVVALFSANKASACTVLPLNSVVQKNDLAAQALNEIKVSIEDVTSVKVEEYSGDYIWTPMCPKGLNAEATFTISFNDEQQLTGGCVAVIKVSKHYLYANNKPEYTTEVIQPAICFY